MARGCSSNSKQSHSNNRQALREQPGRGRGRDIEQGLPGSVDSRRLSSQLAAQQLSLHSGRGGLTGPRAGLRARSSRDGVAKIVAVPERHHVEEVSGCFEKNSRQVSTLRYLYVFTLKYSKARLHPCLIPSSLCMLTFTMHTPPTPPTPPQRGHLGPFPDRLRIPCSIFREWANQTPGPSSPLSNSAAARRRSGRRCCNRNRRYILQLLAAAGSPARQQQQQRRHEGVVAHKPDQSLRALSCR